MEKLVTKKQINQMTIIFALAYMISYVTRTNYGAIVSNMVEQTGYTEDMLSMALTGSFVTYGAGQIISGILGDRLSPKKLVFYGLAATVIMNILLPLCNDPYQMTVVWCINGFAQAFMWPPIARLLTVLLTEEDYKLASVRVSWGSSVGTIVIYLISPGIIWLANWKCVFWFSAICGIIMMFIWNKFSCDVPPSEKPQASVNDKPRKGLSAKVIFAPVMLGVMLGIILQGMLRDGVTTWMPSYISKTYNLQSVISILTSVVLPIFSMVALKLASMLYKKVTNPMLCAGIIFAIGAVSATGLCLFTGLNPVFSVIFSAVLTGSMHGVNLMLIGMIPPYFNKYGSVSTVSGILNACTYIGSAISIYGIAILSRGMGWTFTLFVWLGIACAGTAICLLCSIPWKRKMG